MRAIMWRASPAKRANVPNSGYKAAHYQDKDRLSRNGRPDGRLIDVCVYTGVLHFTCRHDHAGHGRGVVIPYGQCPPTYMAV